LNGINPSLLISDQLRLSPPGSVQLRGWIGEKIDLCIANRVMAQRIEPIIQPFIERQEKDILGWRCEYWGKWFTSVVLALGYQPTPDRQKLFEQALIALTDTQTADGYIGTYHSDFHLGIWDIWGRKYVLLGLIAAFDHTGDENILHAACRLADHLLEEAPPGEVNITATGADVLKGLAPSSILEPIVLLYQRTHEPGYLAFANSIIADWDKANPFLPEGLRLVESALNGVLPLKIGSAKAYEMMSCFEGLCELYRVTGHGEYLDAVMAFADSIRQKERMIVGSGSNHELWCDGVRNQTEVLEQPLETCVTVTWMKLCLQLLRLTGDPLWADELELSLYNALAGAMTPAGNWWSYYSPLNGQRVPSTPQHADVGLSCCVANGPRGLLITPGWSMMTDDEGLVVNLYAPGQASFMLPDGNPVQVILDTDYPKTDEIKLMINPERQGCFTISLRIPAWSLENFLWVNGESVTCQPGTYARLTRMWSAGDQVILRLDLRGRVIPAPSGAPEVAMMRGPVVLALDNRLLEPQDAAARLVPDGKGYVDLTPLVSQPEGIWMAFEAPFEVRPTHFFNHSIIRVLLCDFASAGNAWSENNLYRVWIPQPLFLRHAFVADTWKLMYPFEPVHPML
jgi:uncharacterized protein